MISIAKTARKKIGGSIRSTRFLSPAHYLYKSTIRPCTQCYFHIWAVAPICYLEMLYELQNGYVALLTPHLLSLLEPLAHRQNVVSLVFFYRYYFGRCSSESLLVVLTDCLIFL